MLKDHPACAFAKILSSDPPTQYSATPFGNFPIGCVLSYQAINYEESPSSPLPALPLSIIQNVPCVFDIQSVEERAQLSRINLTLDEAHKLEQSTRQQFQSAKWKESRIGRVTASRFGDVLLHRSPPSEFFINSFFDTRQHSTTPAPINHGLQNESKARNAYCSKTGFVTRTCGLVVNPSLPWLGASPDGVVEDPSMKYLGLLEIKCPFTHRFSTVEKACSDPVFFAMITDDKVALKREHKYYYQIQGQMALCQVSWCDFVIFTLQNFTIERIPFNNEFWNKIQPQLTEFFFKYVLPKACIRNKDN